MGFEIKLGNGINAAMKRKSGKMTCCCPPIKRVLSEIAITLVGISQTYLLERKSCTWILREIMRIICAQWA